MVLSMTGYGQASREAGSLQYKFEIKSLNGKNSDIRFKSNIPIMDREVELRKLVLDKGMRGKFDANLTVEKLSGSEVSFNKDLLQSYFNELKSFSTQNNIKEGDMLQSLIRLPNVVNATEDGISKEDWPIVKEMVLEAVEKLNAFRKTEGASLLHDTVDRVKSIQGLLERVMPFEEKRIEDLRSRIKKNLNLYMSKENVDENRFEQEIIFYLEKLDINEEKVRLNQHCKFFLEEINSTSSQAKGKKLSFIAQEMGREINTLGAKAQQSDIQQIVVEMKDELEKIKEQLLNIL